MSDADYCKCIELERDRERKHRKTIKGSFKASIVSLDQMTDGLDVSKMRIFSDRFRGAEKIYASIDRLFRGPRWRLRAALEVINRHDKDNKLLSVFEKVLRNGSDRKVSICELMLETSSERRLGKPQKSVTGGA